MFKRRGVTLLETVIYLGLLSVVSLIASMNINYLMERKIKSEAVNEFGEIKNMIILETLNCKKEGITSSVNIKEESILIGEKNEIKFKNLKNLGGRDSYILKKNGKFNGEFKIEFIDESGEIYKIIDCNKCGGIHK
ncbi:Tfp pilus assembly protein FimT/FimU [uncultured Clostridium sp.]|uniref:pilus assembly FimT family protein n=1 Tax=uncultured Clostridium sp. TaxID=59620 RepID=UPI002638065C|nr:prepilin-type N-terminal cleavage/methylation domain-containing protein [uncultured Clostridium sp.]